MQDEYSIIGKIMAKYPVITDEEKRVLDEWIIKNGNEERFNSIIDNEIRKEDLKRFLRIKHRKEANREKYHATIAKLKKSGRTNLWYKGQRYMIAASIILTIVVGGFIWYSASRKDKGKDQARNQVIFADVAPGKFKAKLTLADGSVVVLDSAALGKLGQQGNTELFNKDGKLVYISSGKGQKSVEIAYNTLTTAKGETFGTQLADGSKIWLNSGSSIRYPVTFASSERKVEITGEAYFEVAHDHSKPFIVRIGDMEVEVLGTIFNINGYENEGVIKTTLAEGKVKVRKGQSVMVLKPGQQSQANASGLKLNENADIEKELAWKSGFFQFDDDNLKTVMRQLGRWYDVAVIYEGPVPDVSFSGKLRMQSKLSEVLALLEKYRVRFRVEGKQVFVSSQKN